MDKIEEQAKKLEALGWIPEENPPTIMEDVWVTGYSVFADEVRFGYLTIAYFDGAEWGPYNSDGDLSFAVTHYFPLNKPNLP